MLLQVRDGEVGFPSPVPLELEGGHRRGRRVRRTVTQLVADLAGALP